MSFVIQKYATLPPVLRPSCSVQYIPPAGVPTGMPVNCAISNTTGWPWKYYKVITEDNFTTSTYNECDPTGNVDNFEVGSTFIDENGDSTNVFLYQPAIRFNFSGTEYNYGRAMFGYISTEPIRFELYIHITTVYGSIALGPTQSAPLAAVENPAVRLFTQDGTLVQLLVGESTFESCYLPSATYYNEVESLGRPGDNQLYVWDNILPATSCPLFLHFGSTTMGRTAGSSVLIEPASASVTIGFKAEPYVPAV